MAYHTIMLPWIVLFTKNYFWFSCCVETGLEKNNHPGMHSAMVYTHTPNCKKEWSSRLGKRGQQVALGSPPAAPASPPSPPPPRSPWAPGSGLHLCPLSHRTEPRSTVPRDISPSLSTGHMTVPASSLCSCLCFPPSRALAPEL